MKLKTDFYRIHSHFIDCVDIEDNHDFSSEREAMKWFEEFKLQNPEYAANSKFKLSFVSWEMPLEM